MLYILLFIMGMAGGFLAGLIGIGGGVMYVFILPYLLNHLGYPPDEMVQLTIANSIFGTFFAALSGNLALLKKKEVYWNQVLPIALAGSVVSVFLLHFYVNTPSYQKTEFNVVVIFLMLFIIWKTLSQVKITRTKDDEKNTGFGGNALVGAGAGAVAALSGLGGGTIIIPVLNTGFHMTMQKAKSISLGVILITSFVLTIMNLSSTKDFGTETTGYIVWPLALTLSLGVVLASPFGVMVARKMSGKTISYIFVAFVAIVIVDKLIQLL